MKNVIERIEISLLLTMIENRKIYEAQSLFLWDGVKGLQTRKSNATAGLSDIYG